MTTNEIITFSISTSALFIALASLYVQFFHRKTKLNGRLISVSYGKDDFDVELNYSLSNMGNQEILISDIEFLDGNSNRGRAKDGYTRLKDECSDYPYVLKPGEIKLIKVSIKSSELTDVREKGNRAFIMFEFTSTAGRQYEILHEVSELKGRIYPKETKMWNVFTLTNSTR
jgi:hypothetical protein